MNIKFIHEVFLMDFNHTNYLIFIKKIKEYQPISWKFIDIRLGPLIHALYSVYCQILSNEFQLLRLENIMIIRGGCSWPISLLQNRILNKMKTSYT